MRVLELPAGATPRAWGRIHGESFRGEVRALSEIRVYLCTRIGGFKTRDAVLEAARAHLPVLEAYDAALHAELVGIAEGAGVSPELIVACNHYTDLRDLDPDPAKWEPAPTRDDPGAHGDSSGASGPREGDPRPADPSSVASPSDNGYQGASGLGGDGCSVFCVQTPTGRILAQTWDMHATAIPYVMVLKTPTAALLTVTGCLGMAGMNASRVGVAINNLYSTDATLGVVWSAVVRKALAGASARAAFETIATSPIGSGRHYCVADNQRVLALEATGTRRKVVLDGAPAAYVHTNHAGDPDIAAHSKVPAGSTTYDRMTKLAEDLARANVADLADAWTRLGSEDGWPRSVCTNMATPESPHGAATCGAIAMNLDTGELWAQQGFVHNVAAEKWHL